MSYDFSQKYTKKDKRITKKYYRKKKDLILTNSTNDNYLFYFKSIYYNDNINNLKRLPNKKILKICNYCKNSAYLINKTTRKYKKSYLKIKDFKQNSFIDPIFYINQIYYIIFFFPIIYNDYDLLMNLLKIHKKVDLARIETHRGNDLLYFACQFSSLKIIKFLIKNYDFNINKSYPEKHDLFCLLCCLNKLKLIKYLIKNTNININNPQFSINNISEYYDKPNGLILACENNFENSYIYENYYELIKYLIKKTKIDINYSYYYHDKQHNEDIYFTTLWYLLKYKKLIKYLIRKNKFKIDLSKYNDLFFLFKIYKYNKKKKTYKKYIHKIIKKQLKTDKNISIEFIENKDFIKYVKYFRPYHKEFFYKVKKYYNNLSKYKFS